MVDGQWLMVDGRALVSQILSIVIVVPVLTICACSRSHEERTDAIPLRIFHASGLTPFIEDIREDCERELGLRLLAEASGSQVACRKVSELGRECDVLMLADDSLVAKLLHEKCSWRIDFATDEIVLGVGTRAPSVEQAEKDWVSVVSDPATRIARVDENQGPIGYRTLLVWKLQETLGAPDLHRKLLAKCNQVVDHASLLTPLLKSGEVDYAFLYRSLCTASDIRFIELDRRVNLGDVQTDYSTARITFRTLKAGSSEKIIVHGSPVMWTLTIPDEVKRKDGIRFVRYLLESARAELENNGFTPLKEPHFYGEREDYEHFAGLARQAGELRE